MLTESVTGRGKSKCKDIESGPSSGCLTYGQEVSMPGAKATNKEDQTWSLTKIKAPRPH